MTTAATATNNPGSPTNTNGIPNGKSARAPMTPIDAAGKISKILDQLSSSDRKRVLAFVSENVE
jgi:hypothetical protein